MMMALLKLLFLLFVSHCVYSYHTDKADCQRDKCENCEFSEVCGMTKDKCKIETFISECFLKAENKCTDENWKILHKGICKSKDYCKIKCHDEGEPVCASDGVVCEQFANECELNAYNRCYNIYKPYKVTSSKKCKSESMCKKIYKPVCGRCGKRYHTFHNKCLLENYNKNSKKGGYKFVDNGECPEMCKENLGGK